MSQPDPDFQPAAAQPRAESATDFFEDAIGDPRKNPFPNSYLEERKRFYLGQWILALVLAGLFALTVFAILIIAAFAAKLNLKPADVRELAAALIGPEVALLGTVVGFYYAERRRP